MASFTTPTLHATGDILSITDWNAVANNTTFLFQAPAADIFNSVATPLGVSTFTTVTLGGTTTLKYGFSVSSNTLLIPITGMYLVTGQVAVAASSSSTIMATSVTLSATSIAQANVTNNSNTVTAVATTVAVCSATNAVGLQGFSGTSVSTTTGANLTYLSAFFIGSQ